MRTLIFIMGLTAVTFSCRDTGLPYDASGAFEAVETIVSAETAGVIKELSLEEGQELSIGQVVGYVDTMQLYLKKKQLEAQVAAILSKQPNIATEIASLQEELNHAKIEQERLTRLVQADAATPKQLDDAIAQVNIIRKRLEAQQSSLGITATSLKEETTPLYFQMEQTNDQLTKSRIVNPVKGLVLSKYVEANEMVTVGKPIYRIADLSTVILRAYVTGDKYTRLKIGEQVKVQVDENEQDYRTFDGVIEWISDKAEFTPKAIQTKNERANLVYATKIRVKNDGTLKIGMYGQVLLAHDTR
ncbi:HlyD family efflux transporter periplasmic adaptor subunit [Olivibacter sp. SDN3]|uniref:HlyD family secretion protein n=1 Tax=Olivibacter sp. SDN3 TaxID=2764720 RepID=UPI001651B036|nr:HlyD family efflux transporter periplasmic adaptor subunit [Olivibacter sp. SDN3]QNL49600.1 HlyD family efflux transporter periplasmic adaptor subunit [Olivibacter sp. SDN3]